MYNKIMLTIIAVGLIWNAAQGVPSFAQDYQPAHFEDRHSSTSLATNVIFRRAVEEIIAACFVDGTEIFC